MTDRFFQIHECRLFANFHFSPKITQFGIIQIREHNIIFIFNKKPEVLKEPGRGTRVGFFKKSLIKKYEINHLMKGKVPK